MELTDGPGEAPHAPTGARGGESDGDSSVTTAEPGSVHILLEDESTTIVLAGEIDADMAAELQEATSAAEAAGKPVVVDAHHVTFMDSSGVAFLARLAIRTPARVKLVNVPPTVRFLLDVTRIGDLLDVIES